MLDVSTTLFFRLFGLAVIACLIYALGRCTYLLYFHPLAKYPGPRLAAVSEFWWAWQFTSGRGYQILLDAHRQYGDIVRTGPNDLSFSSPRSYQDIYGHASKGEGRFLKTEFYQVGGQALAYVRDPEVHARQRKALAYAFSTKALREQEGVVHRYVDLFIKQLATIGEEGKKAVLASEAYNWLTFDIVGDLAFGESFNAVEQAKTHFWIATIFEGSKYSVLIAASNRATILKLLVPFLLPRDAATKYRKHKQLSTEKARKRLSLGPNPQGLTDFFGHMIEKRSLSEEEMAIQAETIILAGSETTATALTTATYFLLKNSTCMAKLQHEVRNAFETIDQINGDSTANLQYLHGVIEESLRLVPPVVIGLPRYSPGAVVDGHYIPAGVSVYNTNFEMARDPRYWRDPDSFLPERWVEKGFGDDKKASQPFSTGPRACIGVNLAYLEMRITLAKVIFAYDLKWDDSKETRNWPYGLSQFGFWQRPDLPIKYHPTLSPSKDAYMNRG